MYIFLSLKSVFFFNFLIIVVNVIISNKSNDQNGVFLFKFMDTENMKGRNKDIIRRL